EVRQDDDEYRPERLAPPGQVLAAEDVGEDDDQQPDPDEEQREPQYGQEHLPSTELLRLRHDSTLRGFLIRLPAQRRRLTRRAVRREVRRATLRLPNISSPRRSVSWPAAFPARATAAPRRPRACPARPGRAG